MDVTADAPRVAAFLPPCASSPGLRMFFRCLSCWLAATVAIGATAAPSDVRVHTVDARELAGVVDARTDSQHLWVRSESEQMAIASSVSWSRIERAEVDGDPVAPGQLRETLGRLASDGPPGILAFAAAPELDSGARSAPARSMAPVAETRSVKSLAMEAFLANFDSDAAPDGLEVAVAALDGEGRPVHVRGNLAVRLWGEREPHGPRGSQSRFVELERWNQPVERDDFDHGVAVYHLRFRTVRPELELDIWPEAAVNARLSAHGQGVYQASAPAAVRKVYPYRGRVQLFTGRRYRQRELVRPRDSGETPTPTHGWPYTLFWAY